MGDPDKLQPLEYRTPTPIKRVSALRYVVATLVAIPVVPFLWFFVGELLETLLPRPEPQPLLGILMIADAILSLTFGVIVFRAITRDPQKIHD